MTDYRFETAIPIRWSDVDAFGVINNACYLTYVEQARLEYCRHLELLHEGEFPFVLGETTLRFLRPGRAGARLVVAMRTVRLGRSSMEMEAEIRDGQTPLVQCRATLVYVDDTLESRPIPAKDRLSIERYEGLTGSD